MSKQFERGQILARAAHEAGRDELRGHQPDRVPGPAKQPRPVVRTGAGFHADQARRQLDDQGRYLVPGSLRLDQDGIAAFIDTVNRKDDLGQIDPYRYYAHGLPLSWF